MGLIQALEAPLVAAGTAALASGLAKLKTFVDGSLGSGETEVPTLVGDEVTAVENYVDATATGTAGMYVKAALGLGAGMISSGAQAVDAALVSGIVHLQGQVDTDLAKAQAAVSASATPSAAAEPAAQEKPAT